MALPLSFGENVFTQQMTTVDKANAVKELLDVHKNKKYVCYLVGIKPSTLQVYLSYHGLSKEIKNYVDEDLINMQFAIRVMNKFSNKNALEILRYLSSLKKNTVRRKLLVSAIYKADQSFSLDDVKKSIKDNSVSISVVLDSGHLSKLQKIANTNEKHYEDMASVILERHLSKL